MMYRKPSDSPWGLVVRCDTLCPGVYVLLNLNEPDRVVMSEEPDEGDKPRPKTADRER